jgi:prepilin-type N-terminal cleavage/methylation domain-containing protein
LERSRGIGVSQPGFTLIELLVVLSIAATVGALVGPNLWQSYQRANERLLVINYAREVTAMRRGLMATKRSISVAEDELSIASSKSGLPDLPAGWAIVANTEIFFLPTCVTNGGHLAFESPTGRAWRLNLGVLDGKIDVELQ